MEATCTQYHIEGPNQLRDLYTIYWHDEENECYRQCPGLYDSERQARNQINYWGGSGDLATLYVPIAD